METTRKILIWVAIAAIAFVIGRCAIDGPVTIGLTEEEVFLKDNALLTDTFMVQTLTRFFKDAATQKLYLDRLTSLPPRLDSLYDLTPVEREILEEKVKIFGAMDNQYIKRLSTILRKSPLRNASTMLMPMPPGPGDDRVKPCPCPPEVVATIYCEWKEEDVMPIIIDTAQWNVIEITIEKIDLNDPTNTELIATSTHPQTKANKLQGGTYVLYRLFNQGNPIPPNTHVRFKVDWSDDQGTPTSTSLIIKITAGVQDN